MYQTLDWIAVNQTRIEKNLYRRYVKEHGEPPALVLYDVTSSYFEGQHNELADYGYNRDGKKGKKQIVIGLLSAADGEPLAVRVFEGNTTDNTTVVDQINILKQEFGVENVIFVGDRGMVKAKQKEALTAADFEYITALTDPQVRKLIETNVIQPELFDKTLHEVAHGKLRLILRRNEATRKKEAHRRADKIQRLECLVEERNRFVQTSKRADPDAGLRRLVRWAKQHKLSKFVTLCLHERDIRLDIDDPQKEADALLDGCYVLESNVSKELLNSQNVDERYRDLQKVEDDFRMMKTVLLQVRPIFLRKSTRTHGHVLIAMLTLKLARHMRQQLSLVFGTTDEDPHATTLQDALISLSQWCFVRCEMGPASFLRIPKPNEHLTTILGALAVPIPTVRTRHNRN